MGRKKIIIIILLTITLRVSGQTGGENIYEFLNLTHSGLISSLGGSNVSLTGNLNMAYHNPALLSSEMDKNLVLNYSNYFAGINYGQAIYSRTFENSGNWAAGVTYLNYGTFTESDVSGVITGTFKASEYAFSFIWSKQIDSLFAVGVNLKPVLSHLENYTSFGFAIDIGASWHNRSELFSAGVTIRNAGLQVTAYAGEPRQKLPFEIQAGFSQRLAHAPMRFTLTLRHIEKFDLTSDSNDKGASGFMENLMRHAVIGAEVIPHRNFYFATGFNYQRRRELQVESNISTVGLSWGFGVRTTMIDFEFGRATYHLAGSSNHISLMVKPALFYKRSGQ